MTQESAIILVFSIVALLGAWVIYIAFKCFDEDSDSAAHLGVFGMVVFLVGAIIAVYTWINTLPHMVVPK